MVVGTRVFIGSTRTLVRFCVDRVDMKGMLGKGQYSGNKNRRGGKGKGEGG